MNIVGVRRKILEGKDRDERCGKSSYLELLFQLASTAKIYLQQHQLPNVPKPTDTPHSSFTPASSTPRNCFVTVTLAKKFHYYQKPISRASVVIFTFVLQMEEHRRKQKHTNGRTFMF
jgi:hypothetical protein